MPAPSMPTSQIENRPFFPLCRSSFRPVAGPSLPAGLERAGRRRLGTRANGIRRELSEGFLVVYPSPSPERDGRGRGT